MTLTGTKKHINKSKGIYSATQNLARTLLRIGFLVFDAPPPKANDDPATLLTDAAADSRMPTVPSPWFNHYGSSCSLRQAQAFHKRSKAIGLSCSDFGMWDSPWPWPQVEEERHFALLLDAPWIPWIPQGLAAGTNNCEKWGLYGDLPAI